MKKYRNTASGIELELPAWPTTLSRDILYGYVRAAGYKKKEADGAWIEVGEADSDHINITTLGHESKAKTKTKTEPATATATKIKKWQVIVVILLWTTVAMWVSPLVWSSRAREALAEKGLLIIDRGDWTDQEVVSKVAEYYGVDIQIMEGGE